MVIATATPNTAINLLTKRVAAQNRYFAYYNGHQRMAFATTPYRRAFSRIYDEYAENLLPAVVEPLVDRLKIISLEIEGNDSNSAGEALWRLWRRNRMDAQANHVHNDALVTGNSYVTVWPNAEGLPVITPQPSDAFTIHYSDIDGEPDWAVKNWQQEDGFVRLTLYYTDRIERYISTEASKDTFNWDKLVYRLLDGESIVRNPYNRVPAFHFANKALKGTYGISELKDAIPVQDALNKSVVDLLVGMEFSSFPQRWAAGIELDEDDGTNPNSLNKQFKPGIDRIFATANESAKFGDFETTDLEQFIKTHDMFCLSMARVTGTPMHNMLIASSVFPSGEGLKTAEQRFVSKIADRQLTFGNTWADVMSFMAVIAQLNLSDEISIKWKLAESRSEREQAEIGGLKKVFGVSNKQIQREAGYSEAQIEQMDKENKEAMPMVTTVPDNTNNNQIDSAADQKLLK